MIHIFFLGYIVSVFYNSDFDKLGILIFGTLGLVYHVKYNFQKRLPLYILLLFNIYLIITLLLFQDYEPLRFSILFILEYGLLYYIYFSIVKDGKQLLYKWIQLLIFYQIIFIFIGLVDFILYQNGVVSEIRDYTASWKVDSLYHNPNPFGIVSSLSFILLFYIDDLFKKYKKVLMGILFLGVLLSGSSMAFLILLIGIVFKYLSLSDIYKLIATITLLLGAYFFLSDGEFINLISNRRVEIWLNAFEYMKENPLFGIGTGNFQLLDDKLINEFGQKHTYGTHSMYVWLLVECGVIGFVIYISFLISLFLQEGNTQQNTILLTYFKKILLTLLLSQTTEFFIDHVEFFQLLYGLIIGSLLALSNSSNIKKGRI